jgi:DNA-binding transcriptional regulator YdaS (Cro superfamily)
MLAAAAGLAWPTRIGVHSPSMNTGASGVTASDAGVAPALVSTGQQVGIEEFRIPQRQCAASVDGRALVMPTGEHAAFTRI